MPKFLVPHRTGAHRVAAISLFRALLAQCRALQLPTSQSTELQNIVRNRFKGQRHVTSHRQLAVSFTAGYEAIDHLDAAVAGNEDSRSYLLDLLAKAHPTAKQNPPPSLWIQKAQKEKERKEKAKLERESRPKSGIFERPIPLEKLSGKRHVPILFSANRIPVLRLKKPQPNHLSAYIDSRIVTRQKRQDRRLRLEAEMALAKEEDNWDFIVHQITGIDSSAGTPAESDPRWTEEVQSSVQQTYEVLDRERQRNREMAEKMQAVVDRETELAKQEKAERKSKKNEESWARRLERRRTGDANDTTSSPGKDPSSE